MSPRSSRAESRDAFLAHLPPHAKDYAAASDRLEALLDRAEKAWPTLDAPDFAAHLAARLPPSKDPGRTLGEVHVEDLYLACACAAGDRAALEALDMTLLPTVAKAIRTLDTTGTLGDDVQQLLRERLLLPRPDGPPRIAGYAGHGPLKAWLKAAAIRHALNLKRPGAREDAVEADRLAAMPLAAPNPELELIRRRHKQHFTDAFSAGLACLDPRDRTLLKLHTLDGLPFEQIGVLYKRDKSTISRWVFSAQQQLQKATRDHLRRTLQLSPTELESVLRVAQSELSLSLSRLLQE